MAGYAGACHRAALRADPMGSNPPYALDPLLVMAPLVVMVAVLVVPRPAIATPVLSR